MLKYEYSIAKHKYYIYTIKLKYLNTQLQKHYFKLSKKKNKIKCVPYS